MTHRILRCAALIVCFSTIGCSVLAPQPDRSRFFNLAAMSAISGDRDAAYAPSAAAPAVMYGLGPIELPAYLDRNELATRVSPTEVTYSTTERWASRSPRRSRRYSCKTSASFSIRTASCHTRGLAVDG